jgi:hypothetical protein
MVFFSSEGHGAVMQRMPVSRVAQTGSYMAVHTCGRGSLHATGSCFALAGDAGDEGAVAGDFGAGAGSEATGACEQAASSSKSGRFQRCDGRMVFSTETGSAGIFQCQG